jgi:hypothetical protein
MLRANSIEEAQVQKTGSLAAKEEEETYHCDIYPVTEGLNSKYTKQAYKTSFNRFLDVINIHDSQVLQDLGSKVMKQMIIKYVIHARDIKKLSRASIQAECNAIFHFL